MTFKSNALGSTNPQGCQARGSPGVKWGLVLKLAVLHNACHSQSVFQAELLYGWVPAWLCPHLLDWYTLESTCWAFYLCWHGSMLSERSKDHALVLQISAGLLDRLCPLGVGPHRLSSRKPQFGISFQWSLWVGPKGSLRVSFSAVWWHSTDHNQCGRARCFQF